MSIFRHNDVLLFQGDSITDSERKPDAAHVPNDPHALGWGYAKMCAGQVLARLPELGIKAYNRAVSGECVFDLAKRWQADCLDLKPNVLSLLVGANDWGRHHLEGWRGQSLEDYEASYRALLDRTLEAMPEVRLVIGEPFHVHPPWMKPEHDEDLRRRRVRVRAIATDYQAIYVPFAEAFERAFESAPPSYWAFDGTHPNLAGYGLMTRTWVEAVLGEGM